MRRIYILFCLCLISSVSVADVSVRVDRNPVIADESFQLIFESDGDVDDEPDFSPLKQSLNVLNSSESSSIKIINGDFSQSKQWILTVLANKTGAIDIPSIHFGNDVTKPLKLDVKSASVGNSSTIGGDIAIETEVDTDSPYVQQQVILTVKLYLSVPVNNAKLSEPEISAGQAILNKLGEDRQYDTQRNGMNYHIVERQYAVFPQHSGEVVISPLIFQGQTGRGGLFGYDPFGPAPKVITKRSDTITLDVKPIPETYTGKTWLPARNIRLQEEWSTVPDKLKQGEAVTRTVTISANGMAASQLAALDEKLPDSFKQYPDQPVFNDDQDADGYIGIRQDKMAIIPTASGDFVMPAIKIPWWNTKTNQQELAELPERTLHVEPSTMSSQLQNNPVPDTQNKRIEPAIVSDEESNNEKPISSESGTDSSIWKWTTFSLLFLWLVTLLLWWLLGKKTTKTQYSNTPVPKRELSINPIKDACLQNNARACRQAVNDWAVNKWPARKGSIDEIIKVYADPEFIKCLEELNASIYGKKNKNWDGTYFLTIFKQQKFDQESHRDGNGKLEPLYKL